MSWVNILATESGMSCTADLGASQILNLSTPSVFSYRKPLGTVQIQQLSLSVLSLNDFPGSIGVLLTFVPSFHNSKYNKFIP